MLILLCATDAMLFPAQLLIQFSLSYFRCKAICVLLQCHALALVFIWLTLIRFQQRLHLWKHCNKNSLTRQTTSKPRFFRHYQPREANK